MDGLTSCGWKLNWFCDANARMTRAQIEIPADRRAIIFPTIREEIGGIPKASREIKLKSYFSIGKRTSE
jgi:hypothetical protein